MADSVVGDSTLPVVGSGDRPGTALTWCLWLIFPLEDTRRFDLCTPRPLTLGREANADVVVASHQASRRHAQLTSVGGDLVLEDLRSLNGTFVNGRPIARQVLREQDVIRIGDRIAIVTRHAADTVESPLVARMADGLWAGPALRRAVAAAHKVAKTDLPVIVQGPTGTGKERVARAIHEWSGRSGQFVAINCAAIPEHLAEAELFGYRKGAFTGAEKPALGHLRAAHRGTLLLDEVSDLPLALQAKLLRVVEQNEVQPLGETQATPIDVRIVVASQRPLDEEVSAGRFRADLHARFNGVTLSLPLLADRKAELPSLVVRLLTSRLGGAPPPLDALLMERLLLHPWPGNVRELDLLTRRLLGLHGHEPSLRLEHLVGSQLEGEIGAVGPTPLPGAAASAPAREPPGASRDERDVQVLLAGLQAHQGNLTKAASLAQISRQRAYRLLVEQSGVDLKTLRKGSVA